MWGWKNRCGGGKNRCGGGKNRCGGGKNRCGGGKNLVRLCVANGEKRIGRIGVGVGRIWLGSA